MDSKGGSLSGRRGILKDLRIEVPDPLAIVDRALGSSPRSPPRSPTKISTVLVTVTAAPKTVTTSITLSAPPPPPPPPASTAVSTVSVTVTATPQPPPPPPAAISTVSVTVTATAKPPPPPPAAISTVSVTVTATALPAAAAITTTSAPPVPPKPARTSTVFLTVTSAPQPTAITPEPGTQRQAPQTADGSGMKTTGLVLVSGLVGSLITILLTALLFMLLKLSKRRKARRRKDALIGVKGVPAESRPPSVYSGKSGLFGGVFELPRSVAPRDMLSGGNDVLIIPQRRIAPPRPSLDRNTSSTTKTPSTNILEYTSQENLIAPVQTPNANNSNILNYTTLENLTPLDRIGLWRDKVLTTPQEILEVSTVVDSEIARRISTLSTLQRAGALARPQSLHRSFPFPSTVPGGDGSADGGGGKEVEKVEEVMENAEIGGAIPMPAPLVPKRGIRHAKPSIDLDISKRYRNTNESSDEANMSTLLGHGNAQPSSLRPGILQPRKEEGDSMAETTNESASTGSSEAMRARKDIALSAFGPPSASKPRFGI